MHKLWLPAEDAVRSRAVIIVSYLLSGATWRNQSTRVSRRRLPTGRQAAGPSFGSASAGRPAVQGGSVVRSKTIDGSMIWGSISIRKTTQTEASGQRSLLDFARF